MKFLELKIPPVALAVLVGTMMWFFSKSVTSSQDPEFWVQLISSLWFCVGAVIALLGVLEFKNAKTTVDPRRPDRTCSMVSSGIYRISRNPMYLGFLIMLSAWTIYLSAIINFLFLPLFVVYMNRFQIAPEERFMIQKFGADYEKYMTEVRRWI